MNPAPYSLRLTALRLGLVAAALAALSSCGAGLITGLAASENTGSPAEVRPPELSFTKVLPLVAEANAQRTVVVTNAQIPASAPVRVVITALGIPVNQIAPTVSGQGGSTSITYILDTGPIVAAFGDPTAGDVSGLLEVLVDGEPIAAAESIVLARQPSAALDPAPAGQLLVSPFGQSVTLRVTGLQPGFDPGNLRMFVQTRNPEQAGQLIRPCSNVTAVPGATPNEARVTATVPGNAFPDKAQVFVREAVSGQSTDVDFFYRPEITLALPSQGPTTGGNFITLIGTALVPHDFTQTPAPLSFQDISLSFEKGGRVVPLAPSDFRQGLSAGDRLVFRMPSSPDGRAGQVDIVLQMQLEGVPVVVREGFLFANPDPFFGPRGAVLDEFPVATVPIAIDNAPAASDVPDFAVLTEEGGAGFVQLLLAQGNGMFLRFGGRRQIGDHEVPAERNPMDMCSADFDGDQIPDLLVVNRGGASALHHVVLGQSKPLPPLGAVHRISGGAGMARCRIGYFDGDNLADVLLIPGPNAPTLRPQVLLSRPLGPGQPAFSQPIEITVRGFEYQAVAVADLDGDGHTDVGVVDGGQLKLDVAYGRGDGTFDPGIQLDFAVPSYAIDPNSTAIGLHAAGNGPLQSLALVLSGDKDGSGADPDGVIAVLHQSSLRVFDAPSGTGIFQLGPDPVGVSLVTDLSTQPNPALEMVTAVRGDPGQSSTLSLAVFRFDGTKFDGLTSGVTVGGELPRQFRALHFGRAFPASTALGGEAVFAVHESDVDGGSEIRLSTLIVADDGAAPLTLLAPDAGDRLPTPVLGIVGGNWSDEAVAGLGGVRDLALARAAGIDILSNDGFGGVPGPGPQLNVPGLLPGSLHLLPAPQGQVESLVFLDDLSRLSVWLPPQPARITGELRLASPNVALRTTALADATRVRVADVDGDGIDDIVALLRFAVGTPGEGDAMLALLRGKSNTGPTELPFFEPTVLTPVHGNATSFALGDFAQVSGSPVRELELALAVPNPTAAGGLDGDHVRFFRYVAGVTPDQDRFEPSAAVGGPTVLLAGSRPTRVESADFDLDGLVDLLVASAGDSTLRLFRNVALPTATAGHVEVISFFASLTSPGAMNPGQPTDLRLADVNGDDALDVIVAVESTVVGPGRVSVAFYLSEEPGVFGDAQLVSPSRLGTFDAALALDLGDWNRDGVLDLFLGWDLAPEFNVRVLFGGSR